MTDSALYGTRTVRQDISLLPLVQVLHMGRVVGIVRQVESPRGRDWEYSVLDANPEFYSDIPCGGHESGVYQVIRTHSALMLGYALNAIPEEMCAGDQEYVHRFHSEGE